MIMETWFEGRVVIVDHLASSARWSLTMLRSDEEGLPPVWMQVGLSSLMMEKLLFRRRSTM